MQLCPNKVRPYTSHSTTLIDARPSYRPFTGEAFTGFCLALPSRLELRCQAVVDSLTTLYVEVQDWQASHSLLCCYIPPFFPFLVMFRHRIRVLHGPWLHAFTHRLESAHRHRQCFLRLERSAFRWSKTLDASQGGMGGTRSNEAYRGVPPLNS